MNEATKKAEQIEQEPKVVELSDKDLDNVAGGVVSVTKSLSNIGNNSQAAVTKSLSNIKNN